ncbi:unnamed protein product [Malus baccata var. baccata]
MEGLVAASSRVATVRIRLRHKHLSFVSASSVQFTRRLYRNRGQVGMRQHPKLRNPIAASAQPLEATLSPSGNMLPSKEVLDVWRNADAVCFDVDSTVCLDEGIDELAEHCGAGKAVAEWTARAMGGSVPFEEALAARLSLFKPSLSQVQDFLEKNPAKLSPGIVELVKKLKAKGTDVYLVSGGFRQMIKRLFLIYQLKTCLLINYCLELPESFWGLTKMSPLQGVVEKPLLSNK